jgi:CheY-like chemotaxis protein
MFDSDGGPVRILFLDDDETRHDVFRAHSRGHYVLHCYTAADAIKALTLEPRFDVASLDHDLELSHYVRFNDAPATATGTGLEVAVYIGTMPVAARPERVIVHSWNPEGAERMATFLESSFVPVVCAPFGDDDRCWPTPIEDKRRVA